MVLIRSNLSNYFREHLFRSDRILQVMVLIRDVFFSFAGRIFSTHDVDDDDDDDDEDEDDERHEEDQLRNPLRSGQTVAVEKNKK